MSVTDAPTASIKARSSKADESWSFTAGEKPDTFYVEYAAE